MYHLTINRVNKTTGAGGSPRRRAVNQSTNSQHQIFSGNRTFYYVIFTFDADLNYNENQSRIRRSVTRVLVVDMCVCNKRKPWCHPQLLPPPCIIAISCVKKKLLEECV